MKILHCSDVHLTQDYGQVPILRKGWRFWKAWYELEVKGRARDYAEAGTKVSALCAAAEQHRVAHLVLSGDLTASATAEEFALARRALGTWADDPRRCTVIPGNHDCHHPAALREKRFERQFGHLLESDLPGYRAAGAYPFAKLLGDELCVVGLHAARLPEVPGLGYGKIGRAQLEALGDLLGDARLDGRAVLVVVHHAPLARDGGPDTPWHRLMDASKLLALLPGPRFAVLHGHIHHRYHHPATAHRPHLFCAGSSTQRGREGYWLLDVQNGQVKGGVAHPLERPARPARASAALR